MWSAAWKSTSATPWLRTWASGTSTSEVVDLMAARIANGIPWSWPTEAACIKDGPDQHLQNADDDAFLKYWYCEKHDDGLWYLHNTDSPTERVG
ncbi:hypothetical protein ABMK89_21545 [Mycobacteroides abscessus subsp. massiliense]